MSVQLLTKSPVLVDHKVKSLNSAIDNVVQLEPSDLVRSLYNNVGAGLATQALLKTEEVAALLDLAKDPQIQTLIASRLTYESKLARAYPVWTLTSPFEYSISAYVAVLLTVSRNWTTFISYCLLMTNGLNLPHKILNELGKNSCISPSPVLV